MENAAVQSVPVPNAWRATLSGLCGSLVAVGLGRFAYTPLIPALIAAGWFTPAQAVYLGAANLAGYLAGALLARPMAARTAPRILLRTMMLAAGASFLACAFPLGFAWFFVWRFAAGLIGGVLMVLGASLVLPCVPPSRRGVASGAIFLGVGLGIAASGTLVPELLRAGLPATWTGIGAVALLLTAIAWGGWPETLLRHDRHAAPIRSGRRLRALYASYALNAMGLVPHFVFLADFVARGLGRGVTAGAHAWVLFGAGAVFGPMLFGAVADRVGFGGALRLIFLAQAIGVGLLAVTAAPAALALSCLIVGASTPGSTALVLGRIHELRPHEPDVQAAAWSRATTAFALLQAVAGYLFSFLFAHTGDYALIFALGSVALLLAFAIDVAAGYSARPGRHAAR